MKGKTLAYSLVPALALIGVFGASIASAHGIWGGMSAATPEEFAATHQKQFENQAALLGITVDEMKNYWADGKSLKEIADEKGITKDQLAAKMKEAHLQQLKNQLQSLVDKGVITQAQADKRMSIMTERMNQAKSGRMGMKFFHRGL